MRDSSVDSRKWNHSEEAFGVIIFDNIFIIFVCMLRLVRLGLLSLFRFMFYLVKAIPGTLVVLFVTSFSITRDIFGMMSDDR